MKQNTKLVHIVETPRDEFQNVCNSLNSNGEEQVLLGAVGMSGIDFISLSTIAVTSIAGSETS